MMNVVSRHEAHTVFAILFLLIVGFLAISYGVTINKHLKKRRMQSVYHQTFLRRQSVKLQKVVKRYWLLKFPAIIIFSYIGCSILWVFNEIREGFVPNQTNNLFHSISLMIYSLNFYFPSSICMYFPLFPMSID